MRKRSKIYKLREKKVDRNKKYSLEDGISVLQSMPKMKFDETINLAIKLGVDPKQSDQNVRGAVALPKGTGKKIRVAVIADSQVAEKAKQAGADFAGMEDLIGKIKEGWMDFDVLIATPAAMQQVRTLGKVLGPKGLMPNPKTGTVTDQVDIAVKEAKAGRVEYRVDKGACVHVIAGKLSFKKEDLVENCNTIIHAIIRAKPASSKGIFFQSCTLSLTMSPGVKIDVGQLAQVTT